MGKISAVVKLVAIAGFVLAAHGFYVWMHNDDWTLLGQIVTGEASEGALFFRLTVPVVEKAVYWMSYEAAQSVFMPIAVVLAAFLLWRYSPRMQLWLRGALSRRPRGYR